MNFAKQVLDLMNIVQDLRFLGAARKCLSLLVALKAKVSSGLIIQPNEVATASPWGSECDHYMALLPIRSRILPLHGSKWLLAT